MHTPASARTIGEHRSDDEILDMKIACIHSAFIWMIGQHCLERSYYGNYVQTKCNCLDFMATPSRHGLNMEKREARYGKPVAQNTARTLNASV
jgi:hypothetical protein